MNKIKLSKNAHFYIIGIWLLIITGLFLLSVKIYNKDFIGAATNSLILGIPILFYRFINAKNVQYEEGFITITSFLKKETTPVNNLQKLSIVGSGNRKLVLVELREPTSFGKFFTFIPIQELKIPSNKSIGINIAPGLTITEY